MPPCTQRITLLITAASGMYSKTKLNARQASKPAWRDSNRDMHSKRKPAHGAAAAEVGPVPLDGSGPLPVGTEGIPLVFWGAHRLGS